MKKNNLQEKYSEKMTREEDSIVLEFLSSLNKKYDYLEAGAGQGRFPFLLKEKKFNLNIKCLEINSDQVIKLKEKGLETIEGSVLEIPFENDSFDIVQASHLIEHFGYPEIIKVLEELFRVTKKDGYVIIRTPLMHLNFYNDIDHIRPYSLKALKQYFQNKQQQKTSHYNVSLIKNWNRYGSLETPFGWRVNKILRYIWIKFNWPKSKATGYVAIFKKI